MFHVAADGRELRGLSQAGPVQTVEGHGIVGIPKEQTLIMQPCFHELIVQARHSFGCVPFFGQNHGQAPGIQCGADDLFYDEGGAERLKSHSLASSAA